MLVIDNRRVPHDLRTVRLIVSANDLNAMSDGNTPRYGFKYPRHSNRYFNATFISNEQEIFYGGKARNSGSPWTRGGGLDRPKFKLPEDRRFNPRSINPYVLYKALPQVKRYSQAELVRAMDLLLQCNQRLVSSGLDEALVLQQTLVQIVTQNE